MNLLSNGYSKPQIILSIYLGIIEREGRAFDETGCRNFQF